MSCGWSCLSHHVLEIYLVELQNIHFPLWPRVCSTAAASLRTVVQESFYDCHLVNVKTEDRFCCCVCLFVIRLTWPQLFLSSPPLPLTSSPSVHHREYIWQCCFCFDLLFLPNFPPSLPRALSHSQDIKVISCQRLNKGLTVPKYNHFSHWLCSL